MKPPKWLQENWFKLAFFVLVFMGLGEGVFAVQINESWGPCPTEDCATEIGYGWQQVFNNESAYEYERLTGASDREFYDFGYKEIQIFGRRENYWSQDCGWWYVTGTVTTLTVTLSDDDTAQIAQATFDVSSATKGVGNATFSWSGMTDPDPGRWTVTVNATAPTMAATFYVYVRGQLNVSSITTNPSSPSTGDSVEIQATIRDHAGNLVTGVSTPNPPNVVEAYVTGGGEYFEVSLTDSDDDGTWTGTFTPQRTGDHKIVVRASDGHQYWVDGRGSVDVVVSGTFPSAFGGSIAKVIVTILLAFLLLRSRRKAMYFLMFMGGRL
jgi:hypothetical protein